MFDGHLQELLTGRLKISVVWANKTVYVSNSFQAFAQVVLNAISLEGH